MASRLHSLPSITSPSTERRRLFTVVIVLSCFLGMITASLWQRPSSAADSSVSTSLWGAHSGGVAGQKYGSRFQHILDDFDRNDAHSTEKRSTTSVDSLALSDLQNELRRLKRPLKVLIHQLEPNGPATSAPSPSPTTADPAHTSPGDAAPVDENVPSPLPPVMHRLVYHSKWARDKTIFVTLVANVGAYISGEVPQCARIVDAMFENAAAPSQIRIGVVEVHPDGTNFSAVPPLSGCVNPKYAQCNQSSFCPSDFVRVRRVQESAVPGEWDRFALAVSMYRNEAYVLLSNAWQHMTVADSTTTPTLPKHWDEGMIHTLAQQSGGARKALTAWLPRAAITSLASSPQNFPCYIAKTSNDQWNVTLGSVNSSAAATTAGVVKRTSLVSTDLLFASGDLLVNVPLDPSIHAASDTVVSIALSLRMFAAGYHTYSMSSATLPQCTRDGGALCAVNPQTSSTRVLDSEDYVKAVISRGWDDQSNTTASPSSATTPHLNARYSVGRTAHARFWTALAFRDNAGTQC
jgi:hypothetical protein